MADLSSPKIMSRAELEAFAEKRRQQGFVLVTTNGTFDLLHVGHIKNLEEAKSLGDMLIVGINSDASVRAYKGLERPFFPDVERAYMLAALDCVDAVCIFDEINIHKPLIELVLPDFHVKGKQSEGICADQPVIEACGGRMYFAEMVEGVSTTDVAKTVVDRWLSLQGE